MLLWAYHARRNTPHKVQTVFLIATFGLFYGPENFLFLQPSGRLAISVARVQPTFRFESKLRSRCYFESMLLSLRDLQKSFSTASAKNRPSTRLMGALALCWLTLPEAAAGMPPGLADKVLSELDGAEEFPKDSHLCGPVDRVGSGQAALPAFAIGEPAR